MGIYEISLVRSGLASSVSVIVKPVQLAPAPNSACSRGQKVAAEIPRSPDDKHYSLNFLDNGRAITIQSFRVKARAAGIVAALQPGCEEMERE